MEITNELNKQSLVQYDCKKLHYALAALSFFIILVLFTVTVQPSVPFWDCGEFLGMMTWQQVPHPPGAPLFSIIGGVVQTLIPFGNLGWQGNMMSVVASALTIMFLYLMTVIVIKNLRKEPIETFADALAVHGSAFVGAIAFGFSATFWFNGIESEVYAMGTFNVAIVLYLLMRWTQVADEPDNERYLLLCMYLTGLSMGVHLLSMLVLFTIILTVYFRKYEVTPKSFIIMALIGLASYYVVIGLIAQGLPAYLSGHNTTKDPTGIGFTIVDSRALQVVTVLIILAGIALCIWAYKKRKAVPALITFGLITVLFTFSVFAHIIIRANANPPMDENSPKTMASLAQYIGREQYGYAPMWPRRYQKQDYFINAYNKQDKNGNYVYGEWNQPSQKVVTIADGRQMYADDWTNVNTSGELTYMWKYQMNQMYFRYFFWNFVGRMSDVQDEGVAWFTTKGAEEANYQTGNFGIFPIRYFALPLLFGLIGLYYHFKRDPKWALTFFATFIVMGILTALYQNQQEPQPRERDYFYVGSFLIWGLWMSVGTYALIDMLGKKVAKATPAVAMILIISFLLVPFNMVYSNYSAYGRDGKWLPFDYAYNVLQSVEQDAILFTNGDNDTFPVWYMQDVEGVRRDVRICNLSLGQTGWYIDQLKNREPWGAKKVPISIADDSLRADEYSSKAFSPEWSPVKTDRIQISKDILSKFTNNQDIINRGEVTMSFVGKNRQQDDKGNAVYFYNTNDKLVRDIIVTNKFERPVYFISSAGNDAMVGLQNYLRVEGFCMRVCPVPQEKINGNNAYNEEVMDAMLLNVDNSDEISKTPKYGIKLRNLNNPSVVYDETDRRTLMMSYPSMFIGYANYLADVKKDFDKAQKVMDVYLEYLPLDKIPLTLDAQYRITNIYKLCNNKDKMLQYANMAIKTCELEIANEDLNPQSVYLEQIGRYYGPYQIGADLYKMVNKYDKAEQQLNKLIANMQSIANQVSPQSEDGQRLIARIASLKISVLELNADKLEAEGNIPAAIEELKRVETQIAQDSTNPYGMYFIGSVQQRRNELERQLGVKTDDTVMALNDTAKQ
jgi:tetratricopeptide (TPR) repeat protein